MSNTPGKTNGVEERPNVIKYPQPKSDKQIKRTKFLDSEKGDNERTQKRVTYVPDTNLTLACLVCLCFNLPLGALAMYMSLSAARLYRDGNTNKGEKHAQCSVLISLFSIVTTVLIVMSIVLWIVINNQNERSQRELERSPA